MFKNFNSINKKVLTIVAFCLVFLFVLGLCACNDVSGDGSYLDDSSDTESIVWGNVEIVENESDTQSNSDSSEDDDTTDSSSDDNIDDDKSESSDKNSSSNNSSVNSDNDDKDTDDNKETDKNFDKVNSNNTSSDNSNSNVSTDDEVGDKDNSSNDATDESSNNSSTDKNDDNKNNKPDDDKNQVDDVIEPDVETPSGHEISGSGTEADPYLDWMDEDLTVTTVNIPAGKTIYYSIRGIADKVLTIDSANVFVMYEGKKYTAKSGKVSFLLESDLLSSDYVVLGIGNVGGTAASFKLGFDDVRGSREKPVIISDITDKSVINIEEGNKDGIYYSYTAQSNGKIRFYISSDNASEIRITNNNLKHTVQVFSGADDLTANTDDNIYELELEVAKGDEIFIHMGITKQGRKYPATEIELYGKYVG